MFNKLKSILSEDVINTGLVTVARLFTGPITMVLIPLFLTKQMQGYWFTFISISALAVFADLGFTTIVTQFAAHEFAHLSVNQENQFEGDSHYFNRIASFFRFIIKWSMTIVVITFPVIFIVGYYILHSEPVTFGWKVPWLIYIMSSGILFLSNVVLSFFEGCNSIAKVQKIRFIATLINFVAVATSLIVGLKLYAIAFGMLFSSLTIGILLSYRFRKLIKQLIRSQIIIYPWRKDVLKLLWKYAISWSSGFFIFQLFTPVAFKYYGSVVAGQIGISLALIMAIFSIANIWLYVANPQMNMFVSRNMTDKLNKLFKKHLILSCGTFILGAIACLIILSSIPAKWGFRERFLDTTNILLLLAVWLIQLLITGMALYLRAHKEEPLVLPSFVSAVFIGLSTILIANFLPSNYLLMGFYCSTLFGFPWIYSIFLRKKSRKLVVNEQG